MTTDWDKFNADMNRASDLGHDLGIKHVVWSIHENNSDLFENRVAFDHKNVMLLYSDGWDDKSPILSPVMASPSWRDVWKAADDIVEKSNDKHHIFLEAARPFNMTDDMLIVELVFGS